jgi:hypothetical protein
MLSCRCVHCLATSVVCMCLEARDRTLKPCKYNFFSTLLSYVLHHIFLYLANSEANNLSPLNFYFVLWNLVSRVRCFIYQNTATCNQWAIVTFLIKLRSYCLYNDIPLSPCPRYPPIPPPPYKQFSMCVFPKKDLAKPHF